VRRAHALAAARPVDTIFDRLARLPSAHPPSVWGVSTAPEREDDAIDHEKRHGVVDAGPSTAPEGASYIV